MQENHKVFIFVVCHLAKIGETIENCVSSVAWVLRQGDLQSCPENKWILVSAKHFFQDVALKWEIAFSPYLIKGLIFISVIWSFELVFCRSLYVLY